MDWINEIVTILGLACIGVLWINAEPAIKFRIWLYRKIYKCQYYDMKWHWRLISCAMCISFWLGLVVTMNLYYAAMISIVAESICRKLSGGGI